MKKFAGFLLALALAGCVATREDIASLEVQIARLEKNLDAMDKRQAALSSKLEEMRQPVESLNSNLQDTQNLLNTLASRFDNVEAKLNATQTTLQATLTQKLSESSERLAALETRWQEGLARLEKTVASNKARPASKTPAKKEPAANTNNRNDHNATGAQPAAPSPLSLFESAYKDFLANRTTVAEKGFENYMQLYPTGSLMDKSLYYSGLIQKEKKNYAKAKEYFETLLSKHPKSPVARAGMLEKAKIFMEEKRTEEAEGMLEYIIMTQPQSREAKEAKELLNAVPTEKH